MTFDEALEPLGIDAFQAEYLGRTWCRLDGACDRFGRLVSWEALNLVLNRLRLEKGSQRLKLVRDGQPVDRGRYLVEGDGLPSAMLDSQGFHSCLREGATLVVNAVDGEFDEVGELADSAQRRLQCQISVNLYAGWRRTKGFDLHWDAHDTLIVQVEGRKHWRVHEPTRRYPLEQDVCPAPRPQGEAVWSGVLERGQALYMPRGWWHVAHPLDEPSLHLTIGITAPKGDQFLRWLVNDLKAQEAVRADVPTGDNPEELSRYLHRLRELIDHSLGDVAFARFRKYTASKLSSRPKIDLPPRPTGICALTNETRLRLTESGRLALHDRANTVAGKMADEPERVGATSTLRDAVALLLNSKSRSLADLYGVTQADSRLRLKMLILEMCQSGWLEVEPASAA